jgi:hypothetical protein
MLSGSAVSDSGAPALANSDARPAADLPLVVEVVTVACDVPLEVDPDRDGVAEAAAVGVPELVVGAAGCSRATDAAPGT